MSRQFKKRLFRIVARVCFGMYGRFPVFGSLRASLAVIRSQDGYLAIARNDRDEYSFPGGIALPWETDESALAREVLEETGLRVLQSRLCLRYFSRVDIPCHLAVFEVQARGDLRESWEGCPVWATLSDLQARITASQRPVVESLGRPTEFVMA